MRIFYLLALFLTLSVPAFAADQCYHAAEAEAEQGIRIHSELMVIGLNCQHMGLRAGHNLYGQYRAFTAEHADLFAEYEDTLMAFFREYSDEEPEKALNALRTKYANKISEDVAKMRPDVFCARYAPRITKAATFSDENLREWAGTHYEAHPVSLPLCQSSDDDIEIAVAFEEDLDKLEE